MSADEELIKVTAAVVNAQLENAANALSGELKTFWRKNLASFRKYIKAAGERYSSTKTLLYKDKAVPLNQIYVSTRLTGNEERITDFRLVEKLVEGESILVEATAGAGKSFFAKYVFLSLLNSGKKIPFFLEPERTAIPSRRCARRAEPRASAQSARPPHRAQAHPRRALDRRP